jgi:dihydrofolate reductase
MFSFMMTSADGYHADPGDALEWHNVDEDFSQFALAQLRDAGTLVFGRVTYEGMAAFWPTPAGEQSDPDVATAMNTTPKIVISRTLSQATWAGTQIISNHAEEALAKLKQQPGKDIVIPGSSTLTASLLQTGLLDELRIMVNPVILGRGRSLFAGAEQTGLKLVKTQQFSSGNVLLCYQPISVRSGVIDHPQRKH